MYIFVILQRVKALFASFSSRSTGSLLSLHQLVMSICFQMLEIVLFHLQLEVNYLRSI